MNFIIKIMIGHHQNDDEMNCFEGFFIIKIVTFLSNHILGEFNGRVGGPNQKGQADAGLGTLGRC